MNGQNLTLHWKQLGQSHGSVNACIEVLASSPVSLFIINISHDGLAVEKEVLTRFF
jgi:hypothetical protein